MLSIFSPLKVTTRTFKIICAIQINDLSLFFLYGTIFCNLQ